MTMMLKVRIMVILKIVKMAGVTKMKIMILGMQQLLVIFELATFMVTFMMMSMRTTTVALMWRTVTVKAPTTIVCWQRYVERRQ